MEILPQEGRKERKEEGHKKKRRKKSKQRKRSVVENLETKRNRGGKRAGETGREIKER